MTSGRLDPRLSLASLQRAGLILATHNPGKLEELRALFAPRGITCTAAGALALPEPDETEVTYVGNARIKARAAAESTGRVALGDDSGIGVDALGGAPGIYTARWAGEPRDWGAAMARAERELAAVGARTPDTRGAEFVCAFVLAAPGGEEVAVEARVRGRFVWPPRGELGAGFEPAFVPAGNERTYGEMRPEERYPINHRARAFAALMARLAA